MMKVKLNKRFFNWLRWLLVAQQNQAITGASVDIIHGVLWYSSISQEVLKIPIRKMSLKDIFLKNLRSYFPGDN